MFFNKKLSTWQATLYKKSRLSLSHRLSVFFCVYRVSHRFFGVFVDSRFFAHASLDFHLYFSSVQGWGVEGWTSMRVRILSCVSLVDLVLVRYIGGEGGGMGGGGDVHAGWGHLFSGSTVPTLDFSHMLCI